MFYIFPNTTLCKVLYLITTVYLISLPFQLPTYEKGYRETRQNRTNSEEEFLSSNNQCTLTFLTFFWAVPLLASGRRFLEPIDLFLYDPSGLEMARWTARNAVSGPIHINYHLASETPVGKWKLSAKMRSYKQGKPSHLNIKVNVSKVPEFHGTSYYVQGLSIFTTWNLLF